MVKNIDTFLHTILDYIKKSNSKNNYPSAKEIYNSLLNKLVIENTSDIYNILTILKQEGCVEAIRLENIKSFRYKYLKDLITVNKSIDKIVISCDQCMQHCKTQDSICNGFIFKVGGKYEVISNILPFFEDRCFKVIDIRRILGDIYQEFDFIEVISGTTISHILREMVDQGKLFSSKIDSVRYFCNNKESIKDIKEIPDEIIVISDKEIPEVTEINYEDQPTQTVCDNIETKEPESNDVDSLMNLFIEKGMQQYYFIKDLVEKQEKTNLELKYKLNEIENLKKIINNLSSSRKDNDSESKILECYEEIKNKDQEILILQRRIQANYQTSEDKINTLMKKLEEARENNKNAHLAYSRQPELEKAIEDLQEEVKLRNDLIKKEKENNKSIISEHNKLFEANKILKITLEDSQKKIKNLEKDKIDLLEILKSPSKKCSIKLHEIVAANKSHEVKKYFMKQQKS